MPSRLISIVVSLFFYIQAGTAQAQELSPEEIKALVAAAAKRSAAQPVSNEKLLHVAEDLSSILHNLANGEMRTPSASELLDLAIEDGVANALLLPTLNLLDSASLVGVPEASGDIFALMTKIDPQLTSALKGHMVAIGMGQHTDRVDVASAQSRFATLGARLGLNHQAPKGDLTLENAAGIRSPISGFNSAEFLARSANGDSQPLQRRSGKVESEKMSVTEKMKAVNWGEVKDEAFEKGDQGAKVGGFIGYALLRGDGVAVGTIVGGTLGALWGAVSEIDRQLPMNEPKNDNNDEPKGPTIGPAPGNSGDDNDSNNDSSDPNKDNGGCEGSGGGTCPGGDADDTGYTPQHDDDGGGQTSPGNGGNIPQDGGDIDPNRGDDNGAFNQPIGPMKPTDDGVTDFGNPNVRDPRGPSRPIHPDDLNDGVTDPAPMR